uniref:Uncharacterized protein n=1 Tax=Cacopsylla melanoneura TaxID=428564 RepID=A0A8D8ZQD8_9HEMI
MQLHASDACSSTLTAWGTSLAAEMHASGSVGSVFFFFFFFLPPFFLSLNMLVNSSGVCFFSCVGYFYKTQDSVSFFVIFKVFKPCNDYGMIQLTSFFFV